MKTIISGAEYFEFKKEGDTFSGKLLNPVKRENDHPTDPQKKAGDLIGYEFEDIDGDIHLIGSSHQITKAITSGVAGVGDYFRIEFLGKGVNAKNQPFNRFNVQAYEDKAEFVKLLTGEVLEETKQAVSSDEKPTKKK